MWFLNFNDGFIEVPFASPSLNIYTVGCEHHCPGCHAQDLQDINHPNRLELTSDLIEEKLRMIPGFYKSICWLGGDPFFQFDECLKISLKVKAWSRNVINVIYTGYELKDWWLKLTDEQKIMINETHLDTYLPYSNNIYPRLINIYPFDYIIDGKWNGKMLGQDGCNQRIWKFDRTESSSDFRFKYITYEDFKRGK